MVFLMLEPVRLQQILQAAKSLSADVWVGSDAITEQQHQELTSDGHRITRFEYELVGASTEIVEDALLMISEHHPGEVVWIQHVAKP